MDGAGVWNAFSSAAVEYGKGGNGGCGLVLIRYRATYRAPRGLMMLIK